MRRGRSGIGGWRNENPRHCRPRGGGNPHFRSPRSIPSYENPRFPLLGSRPHRGSYPYNAHPRDPPDRPPLELHDRSKYRLNNLSRQEDRRPHSQSRPFIPQNLRRNENFYEDQSDQCLVNSMGDVDHRQLNIPHSQEPYRHRTPGPPPHINPWNSFDAPHSHFYSDQSPKKNYRHQEYNESNKLPVHDYPGHRPPSSDHYDATPGPTSNNNNTSFSRSVDDTVDIVRRRLLNRNDPQRLSGDNTSEPAHDERDSESVSQPTTQEPPAKKRTQRQRQTDKSNCDKMKTKIVHQLFKMDKDKIHKLMDNPSSSTKFEYAISSLITESQNSLNRHMRSVAEKSLYSSSTDFIHNDNNTIYEDTFMKQMQCILDPQDTVLLEDIKPIVMAELSKVLQLNDFEPRYDEHLFPYHENMNSEIYAFDSAEQNQFEEPNTASYYNADNFDVTNTSPENYGYDQETEYIESKPIFERRPARTVVIESESPVDKNRHQSRRSLQTPEPNRNDERHNQSLHSDRRILRTPDRRVLRTPERRVLLTPERRESIEQRNVTMPIKRESIDERIRREGLTLPGGSFNCSNDRSFSPDQPPLFDGTAGQLSDDEDPFAELDKQYHVAVDRNFIESDDVLNINMRPHVDNTVSKQIPNTVDHTLNKQIPIPNIKTEIPPPPIAEPLPIIDFSIDSNKDENMQSEIKTETKIDEIISPDISKENKTPLNSTNNNHTLGCGDQNSETATSSKITDSKTTPSYDSTVMKSSTDSNTRKRSIDQRPSHRKEKRKKSESSQADNSKQILNKNIIINVNDCAAKSSEKRHDTPKSVFNLFFSKGGSNKEASKDSKKQPDNTNKSYSDKYVKRKDSAKKENEKSGKKRTSSTSSHSIASPSPNDSHTTSKQDTKTKLKTIDMFMEQPKKVSVHHSHRNTAVNSVPSAKTPENKSTNTCNKFTSPDATILIKKMVTKDTQTTEKKKISKQCQTERKKLSAKWVQTDPVSFEKPVKRSNDAFERMKEIDMEIQVLLQEKFKLYSSIESKDSCHSTMPSLGMTVLSMTPNEENIHDTLSADAIIDDFTNIPVEELEQIALESVQDQDKEEDIVLIPEKPTTVQKKVIQEDRKSSQSPKLRSNRKSKTPNISLIEQIITDDRPLEDIICLDDLEDVPVAKPKKKTQKQKPVPKRNVSKKAKPVKSAEFSFKLKECSVVLVRSDISQYLKKRSQTPDKKPEEDKVKEAKVYVEFEIPPLDNDKLDVPPVEPPIEPPAEPVPDPEPAVEVIEEAVVNDIQFDMLDVSEDIVIGDMCEIKCTEDNDRHDTQVRPISEEIILDNSQSSCDAMVPIEAGQIENICKTYDYSTDEKLRRDSITVTGNADAVLAVECVENDFIAACLDGNVYHFNNEGQLLNTLRGSNLAVTCLTIVKEKYGTTVYTGSLDSRIRYYDLETGLEKGPECNVLSPIQTMDRAWDTIFVGTRTGFVLQFECKNNMLIPVSTVKFSDQSILALRALKEGPRKVLLVAARSENVTVKDAQSGLLLRTLCGPKMTVYTLLFEDGKVYCGTSSHQIHVFDYASGTHTACHEGGKGAVCLRASGGLLFAGCYDGCVYVYRDGDARPMAQLRGPSPMLLSLAIVGTKIIAGYKDRSLYIWKLPLSILQEMIL